MSARRRLVVPVVLALFALVVSQSATNAFLPGFPSGGLLLPWSVSVTPDNGTEPNRPAYTGGYTTTFNVQNTGDSTDTYSFSCSNSANVTCTDITPPSRRLGSGRGITVAVDYNVGAPGVAEVRLQAQGADVSGLGDRDFTVLATPTIAIVAPVLTTGSRALVRTRHPVVRAMLTPNGVPVDTTRTELTWRGETVTTLARHNRGLIEWEPDSARQLAVGDSALIEVTACNGSNECHTVTRWAVLLADNKPVLGFGGMPFEALGRQFSAPFGPGLSVSGAEVETGLGIPSYVSLGAGRSAGLVYSTRQSYPRALVHVDLELTWPAGAPDQIKLLLWDGGVTLDSLVLASPACATGSARRCRATLQGDFAGASFGAPTRKWLTVEARVTSGATTHIGTDSVEVVLVDRRTTPYGSGWWPSGVAKVVSLGNDRIVVGSNGAVSLFRGNGDSVYLAPPGDFSMLEKTSTGWDLRARGSTAKVTFDALGRLVRALDRNGNRDSIVYVSAGDQVATMIDPVGKTITFTYDGNGKLQSLTDPGGRQNRISISAITNQLTYDSSSSPVTRPNVTRYEYVTYPGTHTAVLTKRIGVILDTTIVTYDSAFTRRPVQAALPLVQNEAGAWVKPIIGYGAYERRGYGALVSLDSVYVQVTDPRGYWTRSLLNRWGQARKTWDEVGLIGRTEFTSEGFVAWTEGKTGDSSRVYSDYDALRRLVRTRIVRGPGNVLRPDSLVYDANHRVIERIDARDKKSRITYDAVGNVLYSVTPHNDTTRFWYRTDGLVDSTRAPTDTVSTKFSYEATWRNLSQVTDQAGKLVARHFYDAFGRDTASDSKVRVQLTGTSSAWQWRRSRSFYNVANQTDSTRLSRTGNCNDPCDSPPPWPLPSDTLRTQRVSYRFDRAGRDSLRLNDRGIATMYVYDRLGRLTSRRPWTDSMAVKDSMVYDVAGNVKKTITRRGDLITADYDSRNRDTLSVIPGVGTQRKAFGGPLDQLTRLWLASPVDSIGGVNAEVRWGYDQSGRLKADTSYTGSTVRATSYAYDIYERPSTMTDPLGTWSTRYEADRGYADTLITPMGDTITYTFDAKDRAIGPYIQGGGPAQQRVPSFSQVGELKVLDHTVSTSPSFTAGRWLRDPVWWPDEPGSDLTPLWTEQRGVGTALDTLRDSVTYDGWERVTRRVAIKTGAGVVWRDSVVFDRAGNTRTWRGFKAWFGSNDEVYDLVTNRLGSTAGGTIFTYDRAGNLIQKVAGSETWVYTYDALNRLRAVRYNGILLARYAYDVLGRRIAKRLYAGGVYTRFVYNGSNVAFETDSAGTVGLRYTWGPGADDLIAISDATGGHYYVVQDRLGSVRGLIRRDGTWIRSLRYWLFGAVQSNDSAPGAPSWALRYLWTGREYDAETGFYFHRTRYYDPEVGRFVQEDKIGYAGGGNLYAYAGGNPVDARDPSGLMANYSLMYYGTLRTRTGDRSDGWFTGGWTWVEDGFGGGEYMPPGLNPGAQEAFVGGVVGIGAVRASGTTTYVITVASAGGSTVTITTTSSEVASSILAANLGNAGNTEHYAAGEPRNAPLVITHRAEGIPKQVEFWGTDFTHGDRGHWKLGLIDPDRRSFRFEGQRHYVDHAYYTGWYFSMRYGRIWAQGWHFPQVGYGIFVAYPGRYCGCGT